jgi:DNA-3-methyladenine glycosylase I
MESRCDWGTSNELMNEYHDQEWGVPVHDDNKLFEFLLLEGFQAGLSWSTVLNKREAFREAFDHFDPVVVASYDQKKVDELMQNSLIIRNRLKIEAAISNAKAFLKVQEECGSFDNYIWQFTGNKPVVNSFRTLKELPARTSLSDQISNDLKKRGFKFVGSTIVYAHMQATGMVNDHLAHCFRYYEINKMS